MASEPPKPDLAFLQRRIPELALRGVHTLKTWPIYYKEVAVLTKRFEIRVSDRDFRVGDILHLCEYELSSSTYTGRCLYRYVPYVMSIRAEDIATGEMRTCSIMTIEPKPWLPNDMPSVLVIPEI